MIDPKRIVASYLGAQAIGVAAWWVLLFLHPPSQKWFQPAAWPVESLLAFWLADFVVLIGGSMLAAHGVAQAKPWAGTAVWSLAVAVWYPTLVCVATSILSGEAWVASALMVGMAGGSLAMATIHGHANQAPAILRVTPMTTTSAIGWTLAQTLLFWTAFLWIVPMGLVELEHRLGVPAFHHTGQAVGSIILFALASTLGLGSGLTMALRGQGTPLPTATAPRLVIAGPYRYVRNPMALAGIEQGLAVGWFLGSYTVLIYALAGAIAWHHLVRPVEEADLKKRFGDQYLRYQRSVKLWLPGLPVKLDSELS